ncbi:serine/threonine protein kinase [Leucobacter sp. CSA2]|uniref:Serine/threonine protein kinase n=1 Tax=Leucobacter edaphi TaxID=2796472 RepID=A0A934QDW9_9MICO|nr:serine/threonine-protein kinase [Leucobacter edaphi]MBK0421449.1 serine/threonine protein kinase [Leucobacter edaphi]
MPDHHSGEALGALYRLGEPLGAGASGEVWTAIPVGGEPVLAAKILRAEHASDPRLVERFVRERSVLLELEHENIVAVRDLIVEGDTLAILMELVTGGSLGDLSRERGTLPPAAALSICAQVFRALAAAHANGVTHRDVKPDNVLLTAPWESGDAGTVRVTDFGVASVLDGSGRSTTGILGTPEYMAPELISQGRSSPAGDVYSTGIMLYELLAGRTPFAGPGTDFTIAYRHVSSTPPALPVPAPICRAISMLLAKNPEERPTAADAAAGLERLARLHAGLPPLRPAPVPHAFLESERPATVVRGDLLAGNDDRAEVARSLPAAAPVLGEAGSRTVVRAMAPAEPLHIPPPAAPPRSARPAWLTRRFIVLAAVAVAALIGGAVWLAFALGGNPGPDARSQVAVTASQQDQPLPTGLGTSRSAEYHPETGEITLKLTLTAQKAPLSGEFYAAMPPLSEGGPCPKVIWAGASGTPHQGSVTGISGTCGWSLSGITIPADGNLTVTGSFSGSVKDAAALQAWLDRAATDTNATISDSLAVSTAYPAQRLQGVQVRVPSRAVSQTPLAVTLLPMWPGGTDELNPLFQSPSTGKPSQMLTDVAGDASPVRFDDGCSGAVAVAKDGTTVTVLTVASDCRLRATVGNFTGLESNAFSVTTRG